MQLYLCIQRKTRFTKYVCFFEKVAAMFFKQSFQIVTWRNELITLFGKNGLVSETPLQFILGILKDDEAKNRHA